MRGPLIRGADRGPLTGDIVYVYSTTADGVEGGLCSGTGMVSILNVAEGLVKRKRCQPLKSRG